LIYLSKAGASYTTKEIKYLDNKGRVKYTERIINNRIDEEKVIRTYRKKSNSKIIKTRIDTIYKD